ncbi:MAG: hypothetical protein ACRD3W_30350, partial [Terriglobales bacterium]
MDVVTMKDCSHCFRFSWFLFAQISFSALSLVLLLGCGGGSGSSSGGQPPQAAPDFSLSVDPDSISVGQGSSTTIKVSVVGINGFNSQVSISITGMPTGVTVTPASFTLPAASEQTVTLASAVSTALGSVTLSIAGTSGSLSHTGHLSVGVDSLATAMHPPVRTRYLRTDAQWSYGFLNFFPQQW